MPFRLGVVALAAVTVKEAAAALLCLSDRVLHFALLFVRTRRVKVLNLAGIRRLDVGEFVRAHSKSGVMTGVLFVRAVEGGLWWNSNCFG